MRRALCPASSTVAGGCHFPSLALRDMRNQIRILCLAALCLLLSACAGVREHRQEAMAPKALLPALAVIESDKSAAFGAVTRELVKQWKGPVEIYRLNPALDFDQGLLDRVQADHADLIAAVGLRAARYARRLRGKKVVFCQVFNYESAGLLTDWMKGVSAIPSARDQFRLWRSLNPQLKRVVVITGPRLGILMKEARVAAAEYGIHLTHIRVSTDIGFRYAFDRLDARPQGLWLLPDNRVLSIPVLRDVFAEAQQRGVQVAAFSPQLLSLGALFTADSDPADVAAVTIARLRSAVAGSVVPGPPIVPLTRLVAHINADAAARLGLVIPPALRDDVSASDTHRH